MTQPSVELPIRPCARDRAPNKNSAKDRADHQEVACELKNSQLAASRKGAALLAAFRECSWTEPTLRGRVQAQEQMRIALQSLRDDPVIRALTEGDPTILKHAEILLLRCAAALKRPEVQHLKIGDNRWFRRILVIELACNVRNFSIDSHALTLLRGELLSTYNQILAEPEFEDWANTPGYVKLIVARNSEPRRWLREARSKIDEILQDPEFAYWADRPGAVLTAVVVSRHPRAKLKSAQNIADSILAEPEFNDWADMPGAVRSVALKSKNPRTTLRRAGATLDEILEDPEFKLWAELPGEVRNMILAGGDVRRKLRTIQQTVDTILTEPEFEEWWDTPAAVRRFATRWANPRNKLREVSRTIDEILLEPEFEVWATLPGMVRDVVSCSSDPRARLRDIEANFEKLSHDPEFEYWADSPGAIRYAARSKDPGTKLHNARIMSEAILRDTEFSDWREVPWAVREAALKWSDPRTKLRDATQIFNEISKEPDFANWRDVSSLLRAAVLNYENPRKKLRDVDAATAEILQEAEFIDWIDTPGGVRNVAFRHKNPRKKLRAVAATCAEILQDPAFEEWRKVPKLVREAACSHSDPKILLKNIASARVQILTDHFDFVRKLLPKRTYQELCAHYSEQPPSPQPRLPRTLFHVKLAIALSGGLYNALSIYHSAKKVDFPYTRATFIGPLEVRRRRVAGNFNSHDIRMMRAADDDIDETIFGLARCTSPDKEHIRALMVDQIVSCFKEKPFAYIGLENATMDSLRLFRGSTNMDIDASIVVETDARTFNALCSFRAGLRMESAAFRHLRIERGNVNNRLATLDGNFGVVNLDYWGHFCRGTQMGLTNLFGRRLIASDGLVFVTVANRLIDRDRSQRAGFSCDQGETIERILGELAHTSDYVIRAFTALPYRGGMNESCGMDMLYCTAHVQRRT